MSRLQPRFASLAAANRTALVGFITACDPDAGTTVDTMHAMVAAGTDVIELGMPFSDPMADGPAIQKASERALAHGATLRDVLDVVASFRQRDADTPIVLMGYTNPIGAFGPETFAKAAFSAGIDGTIIVDLTPEEGSNELAAFRDAGIDPIFLIAPNSTPERIAYLCKNSTGFVYLVSVKGVTGTRQATVDQVRSQVEEIRAHTNLPVGIGFGIRDAASAGEMASVADAVIVGTVLVEEFAAHEEEPAKIPGAVANVVAELRSGIDAAT